MPRLLNNAERASIAEVIDSIRLYCSSWNKMTEICRLAEIDLESFINQERGSKIKCLIKAFEYYHKIDKSDKRLYELIRNAIPVEKARNDEEYKSAVARINEIFKAPGINMHFDTVQRLGLIDLNNPPSEFVGIRSNAGMLAQLEERGVPKELLKYCPEETFDGDGSLALFEATKGLFEELREKLDIPAGYDGCRLVDDVMGGDSPALRLTPMQSEQDKKEQRAMQMLFKAAFMTIRNPLAHQPSLYWKGEQDLLDYFSILSFLYRKLSQCSVASKF